jgi:hypothetical protein
MERFTTVDLMPLLLKGLRGKLSRITIVILRPLAVAFVWRIRQHLRAGEKTPVPAMASGGT